MRKILVYDQDLTKYTPIGGNVDVDKLRFCVLNAQDSVLEETLGEELLEKITELFDPNTTFPEGPYKKLYDKYINPFLIRQAAVEYIRIGAYRIDNGGISKPAPQNTQAPDQAEIEYLAMNQQYKADMYKERMERYLCRTPILPEYRHNADSIVNPNNDNLLGGLYF